MCILLVLLPVDVDLGFEWLKTFIHVSGHGCQSHNSIQMLEYPLSCVFSVSYVWLVLVLVARAMVASQDNDRGAVPDRRTAVGGSCSGWIAGCHHESLRNLKVGRSRQ